MSTLRGLALRGEHITDDGVFNLLRLDHLELLLLQSESLTDACVGTLTRMPWVHDLALLDSGLTEDGAKRLSDALPGCNVTVTSRRNSLVWP